jgi:hypothetical protein
LASIFLLWGTIVKPKRRFPALMSASAAGAEGIPTAGKNPAMKNSRKYPFMVVLLSQAVSQLIVFLLRLPYSPA